MSTNSDTILSELNRSLDGLKAGSVIPLATALATAPILNRPRRGRPLGSKNQVKPVGRGRPPASPLDSRIKNPEFADDIRALKEKYGFRNTKELLMRAREATNTRMRFEMTDERRNRMLAMFTKGMRPREVAAKMGCSQAHANLVRRQMARGVRKSA